MMQRLRKNILPLLILAAGTILLAVGLFKVWQGQSVKMPISPLADIRAENTGGKISEPEDTTSLSSQDSISLFDKLLEKKFVIIKKSTHSNSNVKPLYSKRPKPGDDLGTLTIPSLSMSLPLYEGTKDKELDKGVGHYAGSVLPGEPDNCVLSGHRDTVFSELKSLKKGDDLLIKTSAGTFTYRIHEIRIVDKEDTTVIVPKPRAYLTLTTCYPFTYIGSAPERYIISAYLITK